MSEEAAFEYTPTLTLDPNASPAGAAAVAAAIQQ